MGPSGAAQSMTGRNQTVYIGEKSDQSTNIFDYGQTVQDGKNVLFTLNGKPQSSYIDHQDKELRSKDSKMVALQKK